MDKQTSSTSFKDKLKIFFCAKPPDLKNNEPIVYKNHQQKKENPIKKQQRQTLSLDDVFLKFSRKNIVEEEFFTNDVLNLQLEKHISTRIKGTLVGLIKGEFTQESTQSIKIPIYLNEKAVKTIPYRQQIQTQAPLKVRRNCLDLLLYQTNQTYAGSKKIRLKAQNIPINQPNIQINLARTAKNIQQQHKQILNVIETYGGLVDNIIIICSKYIQPLQCNTQLIQKHKQYLFELERVRQNQDLVCNIIYMSRNASFLKLNDKVFKQFIISQMDLTLEQETRMNSILSKLVQYKYHKQVIYIVRKLKKQTFGTRSLFEPFVMDISGLNQNIKKIIVEMKDMIFKEETLQCTPQLNQPTPLFQEKLISETDEK